MTVLFIPLTDIFVDYAWNCRRESDVRSNESNAIADEKRIAQGEGLRGLKVTLVLRGQDTPVVVRPVTRNKTLGGLFTDKPFELVAGFRRYTAISELAAVPGVPIGHIRAEVRELDGPNAVLLNARENTDRQNLALPDLVRACGRLAALGLSQEQIGKELSISLFYVSRMLKVSKLPSAVLAHWRGESKLQIPGRENIVPPQLTLGEMTQLQAQGERESLLPHQILERYISALSPRAPRKSEKSPTDYNKRVYDAATLAGVLVRTGVLQEGSLDWTTVVGPGLPIDLGFNNIDDEFIKKYCEVARLAFAAAREPLTRKEVDLSRTGGSG